MAKKKSGPTLAEALWHPNDTEAFNNDTFHRLLMEQYKVYMEMADRVYSRRSMTNVFFLTFHAIILGVLGLSLSHSPVVPLVGLIVFPLIGLLLLCYAWGRFVQYFRRLSEAKTRVIGELENRLPCSPMWRAERAALNVDRPYNPLRRMELYLPFLFGILYVFSFAYLVYIS
jgi:hypothetical protein